MDGAYGREKRGRVPSIVGTDCRSTRSWLTANHAPQILVHGYLDTLDGFLIAAIQEVEELRFEELTPAQVEAELTSIWRRTYAFASAVEEKRLWRHWLARGRAIKRQ